MNEIDKKTLLAPSVLSQELDAEEVLELAGIMGLEEAVDGQFLVEEGAARRTLFILARGRLDVVQGDDGAIYRMSAGECAGTRAFVDGSPRKAGLRAAGGCVVLTLEPDDFEAALEHHPRLVYKVMRALFRSTHTNLMRVNHESSELRNYVTKSGGRY